MTSVASPASTRRSCAAVPTSRDAGCDAIHPSPCASRSWSTALHAVCKATNGAAKPSASSDTHTTLVFRKMKVSDTVGTTTQTSRETVKAVLGCDGMFSRVRASLQRKQPRFNFSQQFIPAGYKELSIPANPLGTGKDRWRLDPNALHLWPRGQFMMIAQPNHDGSFSCTLWTRDHRNSQ